MGAIKSSLVLNDGMTPALRKINRAMSIMLNNFDAVQKASGQSISTGWINEARQEIGRANAALDEMEENYRRCNQEQERLNDNISDGAGKAGTLLSKVKGIVGAYLGIQGVKALVGLSDAQAQTEARLNLLVTDGGSIDELEKKIHASAMRSRAAYLDTASAVAKLGLNAGNAFDHNMDQVIAYNGVVNLLSIGFGVLRGSTAAASAAQFTYNSALLACPVTWIIMAIMIIIGLLYGVIAIINKVTGSSISATGIIVGTLAAAGAFIWNLVLGVLEFILGVINYLINPFIEIANFIANVFKNPVSSIIYLFQGMADNVLAILQKIASALDFVFGSNMADTVQGWRDGLKGKADALVEKYAPNENYQKVVSNLDLSVEGLGLSRIKYSDAWNAGYSAGENLEASLGNMFNMNDTLSNALETGGVISDIADNTDSIASSLNKTTEELAYLRDIAEKEAINRFTTAEVKVELGGIINNVAANTDLDGVIGYLADELQEALITAAEGVHY
jgi:ABC-type multidrug transport system fused ATPase/permease subunit